jgi:hypothetical protein
MADLTRRGFIKQTSAGAAALGALSAVPRLAIAPISSELPEADLPAAALPGPLVAHVRDVATGEIALLHGTKEIIIHDHALVAKLVKAVL